MSNTVDISINGIKIGRFPISVIKKINEENFKKTFMNVLQKKIMDIVAVSFSNMIRDVKVKTGGIETQLIEALKEAISIKEQIYAQDGIGILSFDILDRMLKINNKNIGWWRVLESKEDFIVNQNYMFISTSKNKGTPSLHNKFGEGYLISRSKYIGNNFRPHKYSIKDKRYVTKFVRELTKNTIDNEAFMDSVIRVTVITILYGIDKSGDSEQ
jgi:hypothetical protein